MLYFAIFDYIFSDIIVTIFIYYYEVSLRLCSSKWYGKKLPFSSSKARNPFIIL